MLKLMDNLYFKSCLALNKFLHDEEGDVNIVSMVVLIGIAVLLAVVFRKQVANLINGMFNTIQNNANSAIN